jgi:TrmH family RNA methyltransferase
MIRISGSKNPILKEIRSLKNKSARNEKGLYFIEGARFVAEALKESIEISYIVLSDAFASASESEELLVKIEQISCKCYVVSDSLFDAISDTLNPQGILAVLKQERKLLENARLTDGMLVILDSIRDPGNMGTIIRTADAAGCAGVIVPDGCVDMYNPKVLRATMGSVFHVPVYHCASVSEALRVCKESGFLLCASYLEGGISIYETDLSGNIALVIGSEAEGISYEAVNQADLLVRIPMTGRAESLNVSAAAAVMMFEALRQREVKKHYQD